MAMTSHASRSIDQAKSINSKRLAVLLGFVGVMAAIRLVAYPVPDGAFVLLGVWLFAAMLYDVTIRPLARITSPESMQAVMFVIDITLLTGFHAEDGGWAPLFTS